MCSATNGKTRAVRGERRLEKRMEEKKKQEDEEEEEEEEEEEKEEEEERAKNIKIIVHVTFSMELTKRASAATALKLRLRPSSLLPT